MRFIVFQSFLTVILFSIQYILYRKVRRSFAGHAWYDHHPRVLSVIFIVFNALWLMMLLLRAVGQGIPHWFLLDVMYPVYVWHFMSVLLGALLLVGKMLKLPFLTIEWMLGRFKRTRPLVLAVRSNERLQKFDAGRRMVLRRSFAAVAGGAALGSAYELYRNGMFEQSTIRLPIKNLPDSFQGFSIGLISDIHSGIFMSAERMHSYSESVNALGADMIVITGDFVNMHLEEAYPLREAFRGLSAPHGVFGVLGNHDFYTRRIDEVAREIEGAGISLLRTRSLAIDRKGDSIHLAGIDDTGRADVAAARFRDVIGDRSEGIPKILLCHRPYFFKDAASAGFDLMLSGHTHGGQVVFGGLGRDVLAPARIASPYVSGLYTEGSSQMYVSRGLGTVGIPIRFNCPPEITKIILERAGTVASQAS